MDGIPTKSIMLDLVGDDPQGYVERFGCKLVEFENEVGTIEGPILRLWVLVLHYFDGDHASALDAWTTTC